MDQNLQIVQDITWSPFLYFLYLFKSLADHLLVFAIGLGILAIASRFNRVKFSRCVVPWLGFNAALLVSSAVMGGLWDTQVYGRFYATPDYVSDFSPFVPIRESQITANFGSRRGFLIDVTIVELQKIWCGLALIAWLLSGLVYWLGKRLFRLRWKPVVHAHPSL
jgi:hypothetical protein